MRYSFAKLVVSIFAGFAWSCSASAESDVRIVAQSQHSESVQSVSFSPDGRMVLSASSDGTAKLWNAVDGKLIQTYKGHSSGVVSAAFFPNGTTFVTGGSDTTIKFWNVGSTDPVRTINIGSEQIKAISIFPDGRTIACATARMGGGTSASPVVLVDAISGQVQKLDGHSSWVETVAVTRDGKYLASGGDDRNLIIRSTSSLSIYKKVEISKDSMVSSIAINPEGDRVYAASGDGAISVVNLQTGQIVSVLREHVSNVPSLAISSSGSLLASAGENLPFSEDNTLRLWDLGSLKMIDSKLGTQFGFHSVSISPDGKRLVTGSNDRSIQIWSLEGVKLQRESIQSVIEEEAQVGVMVAPLRQSANQFVSISTNLSRTSGRANVWDLSTGRLVRTTRLDFAQKKQFVLFSKDGTRAVTDHHDGKLTVYDVLSGRILKTIPNSLPIYSPFEVSDEGRFVAIDGPLSTTNFWDLESGTQRFSLPSPIAPKYAGVTKLISQPNAENLLIAWGTGLVTIAS